jgi:hypothetical protein
MARHELFEEALTRSVTGAFFDVYNTLRFGFLEHIYANYFRLICRNPVAPSVVRVTPSPTDPLDPRGSVLILS